MLNPVLKIGRSCASCICGVLLRVPFEDKEKERAFRKKYQQDLLKGRRRREHETLESALEELRELRITVQKQRYRIWALENKQRRHAQQRQRRRAEFVQNAQAALGTLREEISATKRTKRTKP